MEDKKPLLHFWFLSKSDLIKLLQLKALAEAARVSEVIKGLCNKIQENRCLNKLQNLTWRESSKVKRRNLGKEDLSYILHSSYWDYVTLP